MYGLKHELGLWRRYLVDLWLWLRHYRACGLATKRFELDGVTYPYLIHPYNHTWANERAVEIPVVRALAKSFRDDEILEIGNVLSHYFRGGHQVLDQYEHGLGRRFLRQDIVSYDPRRHYELIVSISTLEHVGWDERPKNPRKALRAVTRVRRFLEPGGKAVFTLPVGYNPHLDRWLGDGSIDATQALCLERFTAENEWREVDLKTALQHDYGHPFQNANAVVFLIVERSGPR